MSTITPEQVKKLFPNASLSTLKRNGFDVSAVDDQTKTMQKATTEQLVESYSRTKSVWKTATEFGMCGQSVHERLVKAGVAEKKNILSDSEKSQIEALYKEGFKSGDGKLKSLASQLKRTVAFVCRYAKSIGLTSLGRELSDDRAKQLVEIVKQSHAENGHPKGNLGNKHSVETRELISKKAIAVASKMTIEEKVKKTEKILKTRLSKYGTLAPPRFGTSWKSSWRTIGGKHKFFRSRWEANYARFLELLKTSGTVLEWLHEPEVFWFEGVSKGTTNYTPDFKVTMADGSIEYHEVKGWMDAKSITKINRMAKHHPSIKLVVRDSNWFKANKHLRSIVPGWEKSR